MYLFLLAKSAFGMLWIMYYLCCGTRVCIDQALVDPEFVIGSQFSLFPLSLTERQIHSAAVSIYQKYQCLRFGGMGQSFIANMRLMFALVRYISRSKLGSGQRLHGIRLFCVFFLTVADDSCCSFFDTT